MADWIGICLPMQETWVQSLVQEDAKCCRATNLMSHNYWAHALQKSHLNERPVHGNLRVVPTHNWRKTHAATKTQNSQN